jgi:hypothetical protein
MSLVKCPGSGLLLPREFVDEKASLKKNIDDLVQDSVNQMSHVKDNYFLTIHAKFSPHNPAEFQISQPVATFKLPSFVSNQLVYWVSHKRGICELLWMVSAKKPGQKLKVEFNTKGVAYLQAKGAMPAS